MASVTLRDIIDEFNLEELTSFGNTEDILITVADVTRPGLQLSGSYEHFGSDRIQLLGNMEMAYLAAESAESRMQKLDALMSTGIPCLVISRHHQAFPEMYECSNRYSVPLLRTPEVTSVFMSSLVKYLNVELAPETTLHGVLVEIYGEGMLIIGESGVGKSETAMELVNRGHRLIADDLVEVRRVSDTTLLGRAPEIIRHLIEIRGLGRKSYERLGISEETTDILGIQIPSITIPVRPGRNLAIIVEVAAINFRQRRMGYNAAQALTERLFGKNE